MMKLKLFLTLFLLAISTFVYARIITLFFNVASIESSKGADEKVFYFAGSIVILILLFVFYKWYQEKGEVPLKSKERKQEIRIIEKNPIEEIANVNKLLTLIKNDDNSFYISFLEMYPNFSTKLININSTMKPSDIEFCAYIKLNLETKRIAQIKKMSVRAVEGKKYRIRKKLNISREDNMYIWMSKI